MTTTDHNLKLRVLLAACWLAWHGCEVTCASTSLGAWVHARRGERMLDVQVYAHGTASYATHDHPWEHRPLTIFDIDPLCTALTST